MFSEQWLGLGAAALVLALNSFVLIPRTIESYHRNFFADEKIRPLGRWSQFFVFCFAIVILGFLIGKYQESTSILALSLILAALSGAMVLDLYFMIIPDRFQLLGVAGAAALLLTGGRPDFVDLALGLSLPFVLIFLNVYYRRYKNKTALGLGDIKCLFWLGLLFGAGSYMLVTVACFLAWVNVAWRFVRGRLDFNRGFAFAPYLVGAALFMLFY